MSDTRIIAWAGEMRRVHQRLRNAVAHARVSIDDPTAEDRRPDPLLYCWGFCAALTGHHDSEDTALFPRLAAMRPELRPVITQLTQDHNMLSHLIATWQGHLRDNAPAATLHSHLDGIEAVMRTHFQYEELTLLPILERLEIDDVTVTEIFGDIA